MTAKRDDYLSEEDVKLLEALTIYDTIALAARKLGIAASTARVRMHSIRQKRIKATNTVNRLNNYGKRDPNLNRLIMPIHREAPKVIDEIPA